MESIRYEVFKPHRRAVIGQHTNGTFWATVNNLDSDSDQQFGEFPSLFEAKQWVNRLFDLWEGK